MAKATSKQWATSFHKVVKVKSPYRMVLKDKRQHPILLSLQTQTHIPSSRKQSEIPWSKISRLVSMSLNLIFPKTQVFMEKRRCSSSPRLMLVRDLRRKLKSMRRRRWLQVKLSMSYILTNSQHLELGKALILTSLRFILLIMSQEVKMEIMYDIVLTNQCSRAMVQKTLFNMIKPKLVFKGHKLQILNQRLKRPLPVLLKGQPLAETNFQSS